MIAAIERWLRARRIMAACRKLEAIVDRERARMEADRHRQASLKGWDTRRAGR